MISYLNPSNFPALPRRQFHYVDEQLTSDSSIIKTTSPDCETHPDYSDEAILSFRWIPLCDLRDIAKELHSTPPTRTAWGYCRALPHNLVLEILNFA
jgi:hypothetical protein